MKILQAMAAIPADREVPKFEEESSLFEAGLLLILMRELTEPQAQKAQRGLMKAYPDWNELRVSQIQEFEELIPSKSRELRLQVATAVRSYLQEVYQKNHGFDLEYLREDLVEAAKFLSQFPFLGGGAAHVLLFLAGTGEVPMSLGMIRVLYRTGAMKRTSSLKKAQAHLDPVVPVGRRAEFGMRFGTVVEKWCDSKRPLCWECPLLESCPNGKKVYREWTAQQKRLDVQRRRDEERRRKQDERERKRAETLARKRAAELNRQRVREEKKRQAATAKREAAEKKEGARKEALKQAAAKKEAVKKEAARKAAEAKKQISAKKKAAQKAAARKKAAAKKTAAKKKAVKKKAAKKKTVKKQAKKTAKKVTKKSSSNPKKSKSKTSRK